MTRSYQSAREWTCSLPSCGKKFTRTPGRIRNPERAYCSQQCAKRGRTEAALSPVDRTQVVERYQNGEQTGALAAEFGVSGSTLRAALREAGISPDRSRSGQAAWARRVDVPPDEGDLETGFRWCGTCKARKPMTEFYWVAGRSDEKRNRARRCKACRQEKRPAKDARRAARRKHTYGLTQKDFDALLEQQGARCAICLRPFDATAKRPVFIDHCHFDNRVRGLLCVRCNSGLGLFQDDPDLLAAASAYIVGSDHWHPPLGAGEDLDLVGRELQLLKMRGRREAA